MEQDLASAEFDYRLPPQLIASVPVEPRDASRLLVLTSEGRLGSFSQDFTRQEKSFHEIVDLLTSDDLVIVNNAKVLPVRIRGFRVDEKTGGKGGAVEAVLLTPEAPLPGSEAEERCIWAAFLHLSASVRPGMKFIFEPGLVAECLSTTDERRQRQGEVRLLFSLSYNRLVNYLNENGLIPIPQYIEEQWALQKEETPRAKVLEWYQTIFASSVGSAAAPTAGFHFTQNLLQRLRDKGVSFAQLTLHVGIGTFRPMKAERLSQHVMHEEAFCVDETLRQKILETKARGGRIVAVGTTVVRALESWHLLTQGRRVAGSFQTSLFITPGFKFQVVDDLITNFHLPQSTLLVLVASAMSGEASDGAGVRRMKLAYAFAIATGYRFYSFGDAMFIRGRKGRD